MDAGVLTHPLSLLSVAWTAVCLAGGALVVWRYWRTRERWLARQAVGFGLLALSHVVHVVSWLSHALYFAPRVTTGREAIEQANAFSTATGTLGGALGLAGLLVLIAAALRSVTVTPHRG